MEEHKWHFRFRLPWTSSTPGKDAAAKSTSRTPDQKPVSRPRASTSASSQSAPPRTRAPPRTQSQPPPSSSATTRSGAALPRASASRAAARPRAASQPHIPRRAATRRRATSQPSMPTREATATGPPSPPHAFPQAGDGVATPQSPTPPLTESEAAASQPPTRTSVAKETQAADKPPSPPRVSPLQPQVNPSLSLSISETQPPLQAAPQSPVVSQPPTSAAKEPQFTTRTPSPPPVSPEPQVTPSLSLTTSETQPILQATAQFQSLPKLASHPADETSSKPSSPSFKSIQTKPEEEPKPPPPSVSNEEEQRPSRTQPEPQDSRPEEERTMSPTKQRTFQASEMPTRPSETPLPAAVAAPEPDVRPEEFIPGKELKTSIITEEPRHAGPIHPSVPLDSERDQMEKEAIPSRTGGLDTSGSDIERIKGMLDDISTFVYKAAAAAQQQKLTVDEKAIGLITISGENRGASMQLACDAARKGVPVPIKRRYKDNLDEISESASDEEERREYLKNGDQPGRALNCINSNTQSVNSSILLDRSIGEANPGVPPQELVH